jgi:hypothetical protein
MHAIDTGQLGRNPRTCGSISRWSEGRIAELERKIGQQALEIDLLKGCLQRIEEQRMLQAVTGNRGLPKGPGRSESQPGTDH